MKMKTAAVFLLALFAAASAHEDLQTPEYVISLIMLRQGVSNAEQLDCARVSGTDFETLGDAVMERMAGHAMHEQMDAMMGGEGSESLRSMHAAMGRNWLGCQQAAGMRVDMMPVMMRMMGNYYPAYYSGYDYVLLVGAAGWILFAGSLFYFLFRPRKRRRA